MAYLYASSATYRALVEASRKPKVLLTIGAVTTAGCYLLARGTEQLTTASTEDQEQVLRGKVENDADLKRTARNSEAALARLFQSLGKGGSEVDKHLNDNVLLPKVQWHPLAETTRSDTDNRTSDSHQTNPPSARPPQPPMRH